MALQCEHAPLIKLTCPLDSQLLLTWVCSVPASPKPCSRPWHYDEHVLCTPRARAKRAFGTRFARAAPEPTHRAPGLASTAEPRHARPSSPQHAKPPLATSPTGQELAATAADSPCSVQRRPSLFRSPPGPWNSASSSTSVSASARRRHDALATEWRSPATLSAAAAEPPCHAIKRDPEPL